MGLHNMAGMSTVTTGTETITLGSALTGLQSFAASGVVDGEQVPYSIKDGNNWEVGLGTYTASGTTLSRDIVYDSSSGGSKISLSGSAEVRIIILKQTVEELNSNHDYYHYLASALEPDAIEVMQVDTFSYAVASNVTKILTSSWNTRLGASGRLEVRNPLMPTFLRGVTLTGMGSGSTGTIIDPALPTYANARDKYLDRLQILAESVPSYLPVVSTSPVPFLPGAYGAIIIQVTNYNFAWISLRFQNDVYGINVDNEISDTAAIRFANSPFMAVNKLICNEIRGEGGSGQNGGILYYLCPSDWSVIADPGTYDFRDDFMGSSLDTTTEWTRNQTGGTVEIDTLYQWLKLIGTSTWGDNGCHSQSGISRANGKVFQIDIYTGRNSTTVNGHMVGFNDGVGNSYTDFSHGVIFTSDGGSNRLQVYENGNNRGYVGNNPGYTNGTTYRVRITLGASNNATYEIQGGAYGALGGASWTDITPGTTSSSTTPLYAAISAGQVGTMYFSDVKIY